MVAFSDEEAFRKWEKDTEYPSPIFGNPLTFGEYAPKTEDGNGVLIFCFRDSPLRWWSRHKITELAKIAQPLEEALAMNISREDADLFFNLMWPLQVYANRQLNIVPGIDSPEAYLHLSPQERFEVGQALYARVELLNAFVSENPANLASEELRIVQSWKRRVAGKFYILRFLKRYAVFIASAEGSRVYGVLGLHEPLESVLYLQPPPILVEAVLLPFKGRIIYDGILLPYLISFGPGIRRDLNEIYQRAKQAGKIIESLERGVGATQQSKMKKPVRDWSPVLDSIVETTDQLRQAETILQTRAFSLLKASARLAQTAAHDPENLEELNQLTRRTQKALRQLETALDRAE